MANPLANATDWLYHLGDVSTARAVEIGESSADLVVIEQSTYADGTARHYTSDELDAMRGTDGKTIVSYISIGEAETYRAYWDTEWETTAPSWLAEVNPNWTDNIKVEYWDPDWQAIVFTMVDEMIAQGFDGIYMDIIDAYEYFDETDPDAGIDYRAEMVSFVTDIRAHATATLTQLGLDTDFVIIAQNGAELVAEDGYVDVIDGIGQEDLRFYYDDPEVESDFSMQSDEDFNWTLDFLAQAEAADVEVFVVEYMTQARQAEYADELAAEVAALEELGIPIYLGEDRDLIEIYDQSAVASVDDTTDDGTPDDFVVESFAVQYVNASAEEIGASSYDLLILEGKPGETDTADLTDAEVAALVAEGRTVAGYVSVGQTDDARPYWDASWTDDGTDTGTPTDAAPSWLGEQADSYAAAVVEFWNEDWQQIVIEQVVDLASRGYNAIFLDNMLSYYEIAALRDELGTDQSQFYAQEMMNFVQEIAAAAQEINPDFVVIPNGGPYIVGDAGHASDSEEALAYYDAIDAIMAESFFGLVNGYYDDAALNAFQTAFADQGIDVLALEYSTDEDAIAAFVAEAEARGFAVSISDDQALNSLPEPVNTVPGLTLIGTDGADVLEGKDGDDIISGGSGADYVSGGEGDDTLDGNRGRDIISGDGGDDTLKGGRGHDELFGGAGADVLNGNKGRDVLVGEAGNDTLNGGGGRDELFGNDGDDVLNGGKGHDYLEGGAGADVLTGGRGDDEFAGGDGADTFVFAAGSGYDWIADFDVTEDVLRFATEQAYEVVTFDEGIALEFTDGTGVELSGLDQDQIENIVMTFDDALNVV